MTTTPAQRAARYGRIADQLAALFSAGPKATDDPVARMATVCALLHHKLRRFFWTGFYLLKDGRLVVGPYQGPVACAVLPGPEGVCWAGVERDAVVIVPDVQSFSGHVACDSRSRSEIVVPLRDSQGNIMGVLDVDSDRTDAFDETDAEGLERIVALVYS